MVALPLKSSKEGLLRLSTRLFQEFQASKTYGKDPEAIKSIIPLFVSALAQFPIEKIEKAFDLFAQRSDELPTRFDIVNLIKRNGKPPIKESQIIEIRRKDGENRTHDDWALLREWENQQNEEFDSDFCDYEAIKQKDIEIARLRAEIIQLRSENARAWAEVKKARSMAGIPQKISLSEKIQNTIAQMQKDGRTQEEIEQFKSSVSVSA